MAKIVINYAHKPKQPVDHDATQPTTKVAGQRLQPFKKTIRRAAKATLASFDLPKKSEISIAIVGDTEIRRLNRQYRNRDHTTNVLSFAMEDGAQLPAEMAQQAHLLGDVVLSYETVVKEARLRQISTKHHMAHLVIHGVLHLLGYDHERSPEEARQQEELEITTLAGLGIANPYG